MGSRRLRVGSSRSAMQVLGGFPLGWAGLGWAGLGCHVVWGFGVGSEVGWAASCRHTHQKKSGATTLNGSAELRRLRALGGPKLAAPTVAHIERKLAPTISPVSAIMAILV